MGNHKLVKTARGFLIVTPLDITEQSAKDLLGELRSSTGEEWAILVGTDLVSEGLDFAAQWAEFRQLTDGLSGHLKSFTWDGQKYVVEIVLLGLEYHDNGATPGEALANLIDLIRPVIEQEAGE